MMQFKQKGFTLLELLVVITLLAVLSVGALVAYDGVGDNAQATAAANNTAGADRAIRTYRAIELKYPSQFDNLVAKDGSTPAFLADSTQAAFAKVTLAGAFSSAVAAKLEAVGINDIQTRNLGPTTTGVDPNLQHNEGAATGAVTEEAVVALTNISVMPTHNGTAACTIGAGAIAKLNGDPLAAADGLRLNVINDFLEDDACHFVIAVGFGHDAAHSTADSAVAISTAPTYVSKTINPATNYARYVALFHMGTADEDGATPQDVTEADLKAKPTLIAIVDTEGKVIDESIANMNP